MRSLIIILILLPALNCYAQTNTDKPKNPEHFYWSSSNAKEIPFRQTLAHESRLNEAERLELFQKIYARVKPYDEDAIRDVGKNEFDKMIWQTRIELVDLNGNNELEVLAQASDYHVSCGGTGNCAFWIFQKVGEQYKLLMDTRDKDGIGGAEYYTIKENLNYGFKDIVLAAHDSAFEKSLIVFHFDGHKYIETACYIADWEINPGKLRVNPLIYPCK